MERSRCNGGGVKPRRGPGGRNARGLGPSCEALDGRQLLSTAATAMLPAPSAAAVANATAELEALDPSGFARLQAELVQAEGHSRVTAAEAGRLARDEAALDRAIETLGQGRSTPSELLINVQEVNDEIDRAFMGNTTGAAQSFIAILRGAAQEPGSWGRLRETLAGASISPALVQQTAHQMQVVARAAHVPHRLFDSYWNHEYITLIHELGAHPDLNLGPGAADLDAVQVYCDAQVNNFIKG